MRKTIFILFPFFLLSFTLFLFSLNENIGITEVSSENDNLYITKTGTVIMAASGSRDDIQAAVDYASDGDTVIIPAGTFDFGSGHVEIYNKLIHVRGAGRTQTIIEKTGTEYYDRTMFWVSMPYKKGGPIFSDMKLIDTNGPYVEYSADNRTKGIVLGTGCWNFRVYNMEFEGFGESGLEANEYSGAEEYEWKQQGIIYNCNFINNYMPGLGYGVAVYGANDKSWDEPIELGTAYNVFVEDCYFEGQRHHISSGYGSKYVFRYNTCVGNEEHGLDAHGKPYGSETLRGSLSYEIYENIIEEPNQATPRGIGLGGGRGVVYDNTIKDMYYGSNLTVPGCFTGQEGFPCSYPVQDQINNLYIWGNDYINCDYEVFVNAAYGDLIQEDRDYFLYEKSGYTPYTYPHPLRFNEPIISISTSFLEFNATTNGKNPPNQTFQISNSGGGTLDWSITDNVGWLTCSPASGTGGADITVSVDPSALSEGTYSSTIIVSSTNADNSPQYISITLSVTSQSTPLEASFIASPTSGWVPLAVDFTGSATGGVLPYGYSWDFGDGTSSSEQTPTQHTYYQSGDYTVTLTVTDSQSNQDNDSIIINVFINTVLPYLSCSPTSLYFGATTPGNETADQYLRIINAGSGALTWNIEDTADWLSCSPSLGTDRGEITVSVNASGLPQGLYMATIIVSSLEAYNSPQYVSVSLRVYEPEQENPPFGSLDTPVNGSTVSGSIPITGWALDDIETTRVEIKRNSDPEDPPEAIGTDGLVYIGDAAFVEGARPDVEKSYPDYPLNSRAGWGYMLLTNDLPYRGNGFFTIYAFAYDAGGNRVEIARKNIFCDNTSSVKPFGTIDTPVQGESIGGSDYINFGWALTPLPKTIPKDGSTIWVWVDGVQMGEPVYNQYREDIATLYPEYNNAQGSVGYHYLDTTHYENGVHTISWSLMDDGGEVDGIGARYFSIDNIETGNAHPGPFVFNRVNQEDVEGRLRIGIKEVRRGYRLRVDNESEINKKGILKIQPEEMETRRRYRLRVDDRRDINIEDILKIQIEEMEPLRIVLEEGSGGNMKCIGWGENKANVLPIGSTLDREKGIFSWIPTPGFIGRYVFHFAVIDGSYMSKPLRIVVNVNPKSYD